MTKPIQTSASADDRKFDDRLENDPRFRQRIEKARESLRAGRGVRLEDLKPD